MAIRKRKGKSEISYQVYWNNPYTGKRESKICHTLAEAKAFDSITKHRLEHETASLKPQELARDGDERTLEDAVFLYLKEKKFDKEGNRAWIVAIAQVLKHSGHVRLVDFSTDNFKTIPKNMLERPRLHGMGKISPAYVHGQMSRLRTVIRWAHECGMIAVLPLMKLGAAQYARTIPPTPEETARIIAVSPPHLVRVVILGAALGLRVGGAELLALTWDKVDLTEGVVRIDTSRKNPTSPWREIPIRQDLLSVFSEWQVADAQAGLAHLVTCNGKPVKSRLWCRAEKLCKRPKNTKKSPCDFTRKGLVSSMVRLERFELPAYRFVACCSIQLSYSRATRGNLCKKGLIVKNFLEIKFIFQVCSLFCCFC